VFPADVGDAASVDSLAATVLRVWGGVDVLINNAGRFVPGTFLETTVADFDANVVANLRSVFLVSRAFVPGMITRGQGDVFNMSSIAGLQAYASSAGYTAAKFGVTGLSKVMRADLRSKGVRVCTVYPGATVSPAWAGSGVPGERMMPAEDVARAFLDVYRLTRRTVGGDCARLRRATFEPLEFEGRCVPRTLQEGSGAGLANCTGRGSAGRAREI
jgi:NAD(P)-dependent dehydrogenase (short-subunit alcohol dehydrogenase family)